MLPVVLIALLGQQLGPCGVDGPIYCGGESFAFFEFAPLSGRGMGATCACTNPTGAKGEALTFTRASSGTCLKGGTTTGIANGDMVTCTTDQARVMPGGDGTGGSGLLVEGARTNSCLRSQEFDNAAWTKGSSVVAAPTVTANQAVAPDGTTTADRVQFAAATGAEYSALTQTAGAGAYAGSVFIKGNATSGTIDIDCHNGAADSCQACAFVAGSWTRCTCTGAAGTPLLIIGNYPAGCSTARSAADVFLWGGTIEAGAFTSSYIATTSAAVTRGDEAAYFSLPAFPASSTFSMASTVVVGAGVPSDALIGGEPYAAADTLYEAYRQAGGAYRQFIFIGGVSKGDTGGASPQSISLNATHRLAQAYGGSTSGSICVDGTCTTSTLTAFTPISGALRYYVGSHNSAGYEGFVVSKRGCLDPTEPRCR